MNDLPPFLFWAFVIYSVIVGVFLPLYFFLMADRLKRMERAAKLRYELLEKLVWYASKRHEREERREGRM